MPLMGELIKPGEVANTMLWLASNDASFITGEIFTVDAGQSLTTNKYEDFLKEIEAQKSSGALFGVLKP